MLLLALMGGSLGFLRYNTHPARLFMGDVGSQFCGFMLAILGVVAARFETVIPVVIGTTTGISQRPACTSLLENGILRISASSIATAWSDTSLMQ